MISKIAKHLFNVPSKFHYGTTPQMMHDLSAAFLLDQSPRTRKRTKTICTIGPKTQKPQMAIQLIDQGLNVARLNFSHGDHAEHLGQMVGVQTALRSRPNHHASILLDTKGPQIRTGNLVDGKPIYLKKDQQLELTTDYTFLGNTSRIACSYQDLYNSVQVGNKVLFADGGISSVVKRKQNGIVVVHILNEGKLGQKKNMCLPGVTVTLPTINKYDQYDILQFGLKNKVDMIAVSFTRYLSDLKNLRKFLVQKDPEHGPNVHLISKIQNHEAIHNLDEIIEGSDGIMVARGDLGMQVPIEKVVLLQKYIMDKTISHGKYAICATQMLQSMQTKPRPTRAEVSDTTNAVLDLTDATMTSGQTTNGDFPVEAARTLRKIAQQTQISVAYKRIFEYKKKYLSDKDALGAIALSFELIVDLIFIETNDIRMINRLACLRPRAYICVFSDDPVVKKLTALNFGVYAFAAKYIKNPQEFVATVGSDLVHGGRAKILKLETNNKNKFVSYHVVRVGY